MSPALTVRVVEVVRETADAHSLVLEPEEGDRARFAYRPGQFLTVRVPSDRPGGAARCYSLCSSPGRDEHLKVTVKRTAGGYASNWICDHVTEGDTLEVLRPAGTFTPRSLDGDFLLLAAGSGVTPVMSILTSVLHAGTGRVALLYANRDEKSVIFRDQLAALVREYGERLTVLHWLESLQGRPTEAALRALAAPYTGRDAFVCGPGPFMDLATGALTGLGVPPDRITVERFTSLAGDPFAEPAAGPGPGPDSSGPAATAEVELDGERHTVRWPRDTPLLDALLAAGLDAPYSCREGACSACACVLTEGEVVMERNEVLDAQDLADGLILACQARPAADRLKATYDG
ncbi:ferredoxin--NADP reductase [Streptomyces nitrosporeus]|uniref:Ferredoxin--NADP reductase n=1 Tax=Streptomyces nitrosporeus TaxID=28894 RepID=A0A5J6F7Z0_9ACTN|nr:ferredoxin--NADP reductase [Streptomyces nitrosporeus]QEU71115.1 ferredoxin--NADP reductase [Streptomyces nitrosporeus]GGZ15210.1 3-ketosteroid-9-alpha-hydroxylase reductase subunit [Streptomyces nitrosporeus]